MQLPGIISSLSNPYIQQRLLTGLSNEGPISIIPVEGSVTGGRSFWAYKRSGFLEFQERFLEEASVALVWLFGVNAMKGLFDKFVQNPKFANIMRGIYINADWSTGFMRQFLPGKVKPSILLSPLEAFSNSFSTLTRTLAMKSLKWGIAVSVPLLLCGYVIPKLNQKKTKWILETFYKKHQDPTRTQLQIHNHPVGVPQEINSQAKQDLGFSPILPKPETLTYNKTPDGNLLSPWLSPTYTKGDFGASFIPPPWGSNTWGQSNCWNQYPYAGYSYPYNMQYPRFGGGVTHQQKRGLRFGSLGGLGALASGLQFLNPFKMPFFGGFSQLASLVDNTRYGSILVVDFGITSGRMVTAWPRSKYESLEYGFRDVASLLPYIAVVPGTLWLGNLALNRFSKDHGYAIQVDNQIAEKIKETLKSRLHVSAPGDTISPKALHRLINGIETSQLPQQAQAELAHVRNGMLSQQLRQAQSTEAFGNRFLQELHAFGTNEPRECDEIKAILKPFIDLDQLGSLSKKPFTAEDLEKALTEIWNHKGLQLQQKFHASNALKFAFRHEAGLTQADIEHALQHITDPALRKLLQAQSQRVCRLGSDKVIASMLRRSIDAANLSGKLNTQLYQDMDRIARCVERATQEGVPIDQFIPDHLESVFSDCVKYLNHVTSPARQGEKDELLTLIESLRQKLAADRMSAASEMTQYDIIQLIDKIRSFGQRGRFLPKRLNPNGIGHLADELETIRPIFNETSGRSAQSILWDRIHQVMNDELLGKHIGKGPQRDLIEHYAALIERLKLSASGRYSMLLTESMPHFQEELETQLNHLLMGGLKNEEHFYTMALRVLGRASSAVESGMSGKEFMAIKRRIDPYLDTILKRLGNGETVDTLENFVKANARWRNGIWALGLGLAMIGVGIVIPVLQTRITKALTGKDTHPGLNAMEHRLGINAQ